MAKQVETRDRYRIHGETTLEQFGFVLAEMTKLGLQNIGYELVTDVASYKQRKANGVAGPAFLREFMKENPTFIISALVKHFVADGRTAGAAYASANLLVNEGELVKLGPGNYQRADVKALEAPKKGGAKVGSKGPVRVPKFLPSKAKRTRTRTTPPRYYPVSNKDFLLGIFKGKTDIDISVVNEAFVKDGRAQKSAGSLMTQLANLGYCKMMGGGHWKILAKAQHVKGSIAKRKSQQQQVNGVDVSTAPATEEIANG